MKDDQMEGHIAGMGEIRSVYKIVIRNSARKGLLHVCVYGRI